MVCARRPQNQNANQPSNEKIESKMMKDQQERKSALFALFSWLRDNKSASTSMWRRCRRLTRSWRVRWNHSLPPASSASHQWLLTTEDGNANNRNYTVRCIDHRIYRHKNVAASRRNKVTRWRWWNEEIEFIERTKRNKSKVRRICADNLRRISTVVRLTGWLAFCLFFNGNGIHIVIIK